MSLTQKMLAATLNADFRPEVLAPDNEGRLALAAVSTEEITAVIDRLVELRTYVAGLQEERQEAARKALQDVLGGLTGFSSIEDLIAAASGTEAPVAPSKPKGKGKATTNNNKRYEVVIYDSKKDERRTYVTFNKNLNAVKADPLYASIIKKNPELEDRDEFLRAYSEDYRQAYPINAKWNGQEFHCNDRGPLQAKAQRFFDEFKKENPTADSSEFKTLVKEAYSKP
ncbi:TPA: hypothetical protein U2Q81_000359 [Enterobacter hormaechei]|nr:hypothetical protein [Enterobacter hormaechei]